MMSTATRTQRGDRSDLFRLTDRSGFATFSIKLLLDIACLSENPTGGKSVEDLNLSCHESVKAQDPVEGEEQEKDTLIQEVRMLMNTL